MWIAVRNVRYFVHSSSLTRDLKKPAIMNLLKKKISVNIKSSFTPVVSLVSPRRTMVDHRSVAAVTTMQVAPKAAPKSCVYAHQCMLNNDAYNPHNSVHKSQWSNLSPEESIFK
eukprot:237415_1